MRPSSLSRVVTALRGLAVLSFFLGGPALYMALAESTPSAALYGTVFVLAGGVLLCAAALVRRRIPPGRGREARMA